MARYDTIPEMQNFPNRASFVQGAYRFTRDAEISDFTYNATGGSAPTTCNDAAFGGITLASGTSDNDFVQAQSKVEFIRLNGLGKTYEVLFVGVQLTEATQCDAIVGIGITDAAFIGDSAGLSDAIFLRKPDGAAQWDLVIAYNAGTFPDDYTQVAAIAVADTSAHDIAIRVTTDPTTLGKGLVTVWVDGVVVQQLQTTALPHDEELAVMFGVKNGDSASTNKSLTIGSISFRLER